MKIRKAKNKMAIFLTVVALALPGIACGKEVEFTDNGFRDNDSSTIMARPGDMMGLGSTFWNLQKNNDR